MSKPARTIGIQGSEPEYQLIESIFGTHWQCVPISQSESTASFDVLVQGENASQTDDGVPTISLVSGEDAELEPRVRAGELLVARGPTERLQLHTLERWMRERWHSKELEATVVHPISHEVRGVIGVVQLAAQLLQQSGTAPSTTSKLVNAARRMSRLLEDIRTVVPLRTRGQVAPVFDGAWPQDLEKQLGHLSEADRKRSWSFSVKAQQANAFSTPHVLGVVLGAVEAVEKVTSPDEPLTVEVASDSDRMTATVQANGASPGESFQRQLGVSIADWALLQHREVPFRLVTAALLARQCHGQLEVALQDDQLVIRGSLPARSTD